jgi:biotin carboxyl carrier protein
MAEKHILSPLPGTFFRRPAPDKPPYKNEGDIIAAGDAVGLIEVMKTFYEVKAEFGGTIVKFLVEDSAEVQAGLPIVAVAV